MGSSCIHNGEDGADGAPLGPQDPLCEHAEAAGGRSTAGHRSCSPRQPDPGVVQPLSAVHSDYMSPSLETFPFAQSSGESRSDPSEPGIPGQEAPLAEARGEQQIRGLQGPVRGREQSRELGRAPVPARVPDQTPDEELVQDTRRSQGREVGAKGRSLWGARSLPWERCLRLRGVSVQET